MRAEGAKTLLQEPGSALSVVARRCGFRSVAALRNEFILPIWYNAEGIQAETWLLGRVATRLSEKAQGVCMFEASRKANAGRFWTCQSHNGRRGVLSVSLAVALSYTWEG